MGPEHRIYAPQTPLAAEIAHRQLIFVHFGETLVVGKVVSDRVLPRSARHLPVVRKVPDDPRVDLFHTGSLLLRRFYGQKSQAAKGVDGTSIRGRKLSTRISFLLLLLLFLLIDWLVDAVDSTCGS